MTYAKNLVRKSAYLQVCESADLKARHGQQTIPRRSQTNRAHIGNGVGVSLLERHAAMKWWCVCAVSPIAMTPLSTMGGVK